MMEPGLIMWHSVEEEVKPPVGEDIILAVADDRADNVLYYTMPGVYLRDVFIHNDEVVCGVKYWADYPKYPKKWVV